MSQWEGNKEVGLAPYQTGGIVRGEYVERPEDNKTSDVYAPPEPKKRELIEARQTIETTTAQGSMRTTYYYPGVSQQELDRQIAAQQTSRPSLSSLNIAPQPQIRPVEDKLPTYEVQRGWSRITEVKPYREGEYIGDIFGITKRKVEPRTRYRQDIFGFTSAGEKATDTEPQGYYDFEGERLEQGGKLIMFSPFAFGSLRAANIINVKSFGGKQSIKGDSLADYYDVKSFDKPLKISTGKMPADEFLVKSFEKPTKILGGRMPVDTFTVKGFKQRQPLVESRELGAFTVKAKSSELRALGVPPKPRGRTDSIVMGRTPVDVYEQRALKVQGTRLKAFLQSEEATFAPQKQQTVMQPPSTELQKRFGMRLGRESSYFSRIRNIPGSKASLKLWTSPAVQVSPSLKLRTFTGLKQQTPLVNRLDMFTGVDTGIDLLNPTATRTGLMTDQSYQQIERQLQRQVQQQRRSQRPRFSIKEGMRFPPAQKKIPKIPKLKKDSLTDFGLPKQRKGKMKSWKVRNPFLSLTGVRE